MSFVHVSQHVKVVTISILLFMLIGCGGARTATTSSESSSNSGTNANLGSGSVTLDWVPPIENADGSTLQNLAGYRVYFGTTEGIYSDVITIDNTGITSYVIENLVKGTKYYFVLTAFNSDGVESVNSELVSKKIPAA